MKEFGSGKLPPMTIWTKVAAAFVLCALLTGAAAATSGVGAIMDWVGLTGFFELPDGSGGYVEDGTVITGDVMFDGTMHRVEDGKLLDADGNVIGSIHLNSTCCGEESCSEE